MLGSQVDSKDLFHIVKTNPNTSKHFMSKKLSILPLFLECESQMCLELVANEITQIPNYCKFGKTHYGHSSLPKSKYKILSIVRILTSFYNFFFKLKILTTNICQEEITIGHVHWLLQAF